MKKRISEMIRSIFHLLFSADSFRHAAAAMLSILMAVTLFPVSAAAGQAGYSVTFADYNEESLSGNYSFENVPEGARLYTLDEMQQEIPDFSGEDGCTWYLYLPASEGTSGYQVQAIRDPERDGYVFRDWVNKTASGDDIYTVTGQTVFIARYASTAQYVISLYYQYDNEEHSVAAETSTEPFGLNQDFDMSLPDNQELSGLTPSIHASADASDEEISAVQELNQYLSEGNFSGQIDTDFLSACLAAGFVDWDEENDDYAKDENGNVQIRIPVTYTVAGEITYKVEYLLQDEGGSGSYTAVDADTYTGTVTGTTRISLYDLNLVKEYSGYSLTAESEQNAGEYTVNADGTSVIQLKYDRNKYYIYFQMNGGNAEEPRQLYYGQEITNDILPDPIRVGYDFLSWQWMDKDENVISRPQEMPASDLIVSAEWIGTDTTVTLVYWLENANDENYVVAGQRKISVKSGQTVGYDAGSSSKSTVDVAINDYLTSEEMEEAGIDDGEYFSFASCDSSTAYAEGVSGAPKTAAGDGSTVINIGFSRNEYTLVFHLGRIITEQNWPSGTVQTVQISTGGNSSSSNNWQSGFTWNSVQNNPALTIGGKTYYVSNKNEECYQITAKYGAFISDAWPVGTVDNVGSAYLQDDTEYLLFTWGTSVASPYYASHPSNRNIIGVYATMSSDLIIDPSDPSAVHNLVAYWNNNKSAYKNHHYLFEIVPGIDASEFSISGMEHYDSTDTFSNASFSSVSSLHFYEKSSVEVRTTAAASNQNGPEFAYVTLQYACYNGNDVYFFYTYHDYTLTYHEQNEDLSSSPPTEEKTKNISFHYIDGKYISDQVTGGVDTLNYTPDTPYVSSYGNQYTFDGWYKDAECTLPVEWETAAPAANVAVYAKWKAPTFTLTLIVPGGTIPDSTIEQCRENNYTVAEEEETVGEMTIRTYTISGIPGGTSSNHIIERRGGAVSDYSLSFDYWSYEVDGNSQKYLFDESQLVTSDITLTAQWKTEYAGSYTVRYLTTEEVSTGLEDVTIDGVTYHRLKEDRQVSGIAIGSSLTVDAAAIDGYLSGNGEITHVIDSDASKNFYDFIYSRIEGDVTYYVHYVKDTGVNYGRTSPPDDTVELAETKTVTVNAASLNRSTTVSEPAEAIGGYTPRDSWNVSFTLSADESENHLYFYYVENVHRLPYTVTYHFADENNQYDESGTEYQISFSAEAALGRAITVNELITDYSSYLSQDQAALFEKLMTGHELDQQRTGSSYLLITQSPESNQIDIYLKNIQYTLTYFLNASGGDYPAEWNDYGSSITSLGNGIYSEEFTYPHAPACPESSPERFSYIFTGWNTAADGSGTSYDSENWFSEGSLLQNITLYAQWEKMKKVTYDLRGGSWQEEGDGFYETDQPDIYNAYAVSGTAAVQPADPVLTDQQGTRYSFIGWTVTDPDTDPEFIQEDNRIDIVTFDREYRYDFSTAVDQDITLYAVWDPDVTTFRITKTDMDGNVLSGAGFSLERLEAEVTGDTETGFSYELITDENGNYQTDSQFPERSGTSDENGNLTFENLPAGYYRLTETEAPQGYSGISEPVILFAPYGDGEPSIYYGPEGYISGTSASGDLNITVRNAAQYAVEITAPDSLSLTYSAPDLVWNPETLTYETADGQDAEWKVTSSPPETDITVTNRSLNGNRLDVSISLSYLKDYAYLLNHTTIQESSSGSQAETDSDGNAKVLTEVLSAAESRTFELTAAGIIAADAAIPDSETEAGTITVIVTPHKDG